MVNTTSTNVQLKDGFKQVCLWAGTIVGTDKINDFEKFFADEGFRVQYLEEVTTLPDVIDGKAIRGTGGRNDVLFAIHEDDCLKFAVPRLSMGIRWIEDVFGNGGGHLYDDRIAQYQSW